MKYLFLILVFLPFALLIASIVARIIWIGDKKWIATASIVFFAALTIFERVIGPHVFILIPPLILLYASIIARITWIEDKKWIATTGIVLFTATTILAVIAIPSRWTSRPAIGGTSPVSILNCIRAGQEQFKESKSVDEDGDKVGEYGLLSELAGGCNFRGSEQSCKGSPYIATILAPASNGLAQRHGYYFIIYLAGTEKAFSRMKDAVKDNADRREGDYVAYAFPINIGRFPNRVFAINSKGHIFIIQNEDNRWGGSNIPPPGLAYRDGKDPSVGSGEFVRDGDKGGADEAWHAVK
jgi:hypothetical protein